MSTHLVGAPQWVAPRVVVKDARHGDGLLQPVAGHQERRLLRTLYARLLTVAPHAWERRVHATRRQGPLQWRDHGTGGGGHRRTPLQVHQPLVRELRAPGWREPESALAAVVAHGRRVPVVGARVDIQQAQSGLCLARLLERVARLLPGGWRHRAAQEQQEQRPGAEAQRQPSSGTCWHLAVQASTRSRHSCDNNRPPRAGLSASIGVY